MNSKFQEQQKPRLFVFANRTDPSSVGGLTSLMNDHLDKLRDDYEIHFVGWSGNDGKKAPFADSDKTRKYIDQEKDGIIYHTVDFTREEYEKGYCGFQNQDIWPHAHGMPEKAAFIEGGFEVNRQISELFLKVAQKKAGFNDDDYAFVNDYQLLMLGEVMDEQGVNCYKTFHDHIPVPKLDVLQKSEKKGLTKVDNYKKLFGALKHYNQAGFQTPEGINRVKDILEIAHEENQDYEAYKNDQCLDKDGNSYIFCYNPVCIGVEKYQDMAIDHRNDPQVKEYEEKYLKDGKMTVVVPCRYDYAKKHDLLLEGVRTFAQRYPDEVEDLRVILIGGASRSDIKAYKDYSDAISADADGINRSFTSKGICTKEDPTVVQIKNMERHTLAAVLGLGRQVVWTAGVDGMNLVAIEGLAAGQAGIEYSKEQIAKTIANPKEAMAKDLLEYVFRSNTETMLRPEDDNVIVTSVHCGVSKLLGDGIVTLKETLSPQDVAVNEVVECLHTLLTKDKTKNYAENKKSLDNIKEKYPGANWMKKNVQVFDAVRSD